MFVGVQVLMCMKMCVHTCVHEDSLAVVSRLPTSLFLETPQEFKSPIGLESTNFDEAG